MPECVSGLPVITAKYKKKCKNAEASCTPIILMGSLKNKPLLAEIQHLGQLQQQHSLLPAAFYHLKQMQTQNRAAPWNLTHLSAVLKPPTTSKCSFGSQQEMRENYRIKKNNNIKLNCKFMSITFWLSDSCLCTVTRKRQMIWWYDCDFTY